MFLKIQVYITEPWNTGQSHLFWEQVDYHDPTLHCFEDVSQNLWTLKKGQSDPYLFGDNFHNIPAH